MNNPAFRTPDWREEHRPAIRFPEGYLKAYVGEPEMDLILAALTLQRVANEYIAALRSRP